MSVNISEDAGQLAGPIITGNDEKQIAYAPVLVPGEPDHYGDIVTVETVERVAHRYMADYRNLDVEHTMQPADAEVVEHWITKRAERFGDVTVPLGTWMIGIRARSADLWASIKAGAIAGVSIMGVPKATYPVAAARSVDEPEAALRRQIKNVSMDDLGDDWEVPIVSLVSDTGVPKAKWVILRSRGIQEPAAADEQITESRVTRLLKWLDGEAADPIGSATVVTKGNIDVTPEELTAAIRAEIVGATPAIIAAMREADEAASDGAEDTEAEAVVGGNEPDEDESTEPTLAEQVAALAAGLATLQAAQSEAPAADTAPVASKSLGIPEGAVFNSQTVAPDPDIALIGDHSAPGFERDLFGVARPVAK